MDKLKGSGSTFSTSGKRWKPFKLNPKVSKRNAKLHRMIRAGTLQPMTKDEMRKAADEAVKPGLIIRHETLSRDEVIRRYGKR
jgi:hypothetical protein